MKLPYFDAHCDTCTRGQPLRRNALHIDLERLSAYGPAAQVFAIFTRLRRGTGGAAMPDFTQPDVPADILMGLYDREIASLHAQLAENEDLAVLCRSAAEAKSAARAGKVAVFIAVEGAELLGCSLDKLRSAYDQGVRLVNMTWNWPNRLSGTCMAGGGLTAEGRAFVRGAQEMGVAVDMSHISEAAFWDTLEEARRPVIAGHSDSRALTDHPRNLTDAQFTALVQTGGGAGLNLWPDLLGLGRDVEAVVAHAEHFLALGGEKAVFLGTDLDGIGETPRGIAGVQDMGAVYEAMLRQNWSEDLVRDIFYNNLYGILERAL